VVSRFGSFGKEVSLRLGETMRMVELNTRFLINPI
jgi:hypothetical protein